MRRSAVAGVVFGLVVALFPLATAHAVNGNDCGGAGDAGATSADARPLTPTGNENARAYNCPGEIGNTANPAEDVADWYTLTLTAGQNVVVVSRSIPASAAYRTEIIDPSGAQITQALSVTPAVPSQAACSDEVVLPDRCAFRAPVGGTYTIRILRNGAVDGQYVFAIASGPSQNDCGLNADAGNDETQVKAGGQVPTVTEEAPGQRRFVCEGQFFTEDAKDYYLLPNVSVHTLVVAELSWLDRDWIGGPYGPTLELIRPDGTVGGQPSNSSPPLTMIQEIDVAPIGKPWHIRIGRPAPPPIPSLSHAVGHYRLTVLLGQSDCSTFVEAGSDETTAATQDFPPENTYTIGTPTAPCEGIFDTSFTDPAKDDDEDWYKFTGGSNAMLTGSVSGPAGGSATLKVLDDLNAVRASGNPISFRLPSGASGYWKMAVEQTSGTGGLYNLTYSSADRDCMSPGDAGDGIQSALAFPITNDANVPLNQGACTATLFNEADTDYYSVQPGPGGAIAARLNVATGSPVTGLTVCIFDENGVQKACGTPGLASSAGAAAPVATGASTNWYVSVDGVGIGNYTLEVDRTLLQKVSHSDCGFLDPNNPDSATNGVDAGDTQAAALALTLPVQCNNLPNQGVPTQQQVGPLATPVPLPTNTSTAIPIPPPAGGFAPGNRPWGILQVGSQPDADDWYKVTLGQDSDGLAVFMKPEQNTSDFDLCVVPPTGPMSCSRNTNTDGVARPETVFVPKPSGATGPWYIRVFRASGDYGPYRLMAADREPPCRVNCS